MTALNKYALRGQCVEGSFYLVECCNCGEMYPSNLLDGGGRLRIPVITVIATATCAEPMTLSERILATSIQMKQRHGTFSRSVSRRCWMSWRKRKATPAHTKEKSGITTS